MKYCTNCGAENKDSANFCKNCGRPFKVPQTNQNVSDTISLPPEANAPQEYQDVHQIYSSRHKKVSNKPTAAFILSLVGGILVLIGGLIVSLLDYEMAIPFFLSPLIGIGLIFGIIIIVSAVMLYLKPEQHKRWGFLILIISLISWFGALAGLFIGFLLGFVGGLLAIVWNPPK